MRITYVYVSKIAVVARYIINGISSSRRKLRGLIVDVWKIVMVCMMRARLPIGTYNVQRALIRKECRYDAYVPIRTKLRPIYKTYWWSFLFTQIRETGKRESAQLLFMEFAMASSLYLAQRAMASWAFPLSSTCQIMDQLVAFSG